MKPLNWATLGCGVIANELATALARQNRHLYSVANRTHEKAVAFAEKYQIAKVYDHLEDVFTDPDVDIIYISTEVSSIGSPFFLSTQPSGSSSRSRTVSIPDDSSAVPSA